MSAAAPRFRPYTLDAALAWLAQQQGEVGAPASLDTSRLAERQGLHQLGGRTVVGLDVSYAQIAHSSVLRRTAACLVEACSLNRDATQAADHTLAEALAADHETAVLAAMAALDAEVEIASMRAGDVLDLQWLALTTYLVDPQRLDIHLPLSIRFASPAASGSALACQLSVPGVSLAVSVAVAVLVFEISGGAEQAARVGGAGLAFGAAQQIPQRLPQAEAALLGRSISVEVIEAAIQAARRDTSGWLAPAGSPGGFVLDPSSHLLRQAIDRAASRARAVFDS